MFRRADEQVAVRHVDGDIRDEKHEEGRTRDVHVGIMGPEAAGEEQPDKLRKTVRFEQEAPSAAVSSDPTVALKYRARVVRHKINWCPYLCGSQVMLMTTYKVLRWMHSRRMDQRVVASKKCWNGIEEKISREVT